MAPWGKLTLLLFALVLLTGNIDCQFIELNHKGLGDEASSQQFFQNPFNLNEIPVSPEHKELQLHHFTFRSPEHIATHVDAPFHFADAGWTIEKIPIEKLITQVVTIDIRDKVRSNSIYQLTSQDVKDWVEENGMFPNNSVVLVNTGWSKRYGDRRSYYGVDSTDLTKYVFPGISGSAAQTFVDYRESHNIHIAGVGTDTPSTDYGPSKTFDAHRIFCGNNIYLMEHLNNLDIVPTRGAEITVMPMKIIGGSGAPARVIVRTGDDNKYCNKSDNIENKMVLSILAIVLVLCNAAIGV